MKTKTCRFNASGVFNSNYMILPNSMPSLAIYCGNKGTTSELAEILAEQQLEGGLDEVGEVTYPDEDSEDEEVAELNFD